MFKNTISSAGVGFLVLVSGGIANSAPHSPTVLTPSYQVAQGTINTAAIEASVFQKINQYRASQNLPALTRNSQIDSQARIHSQNMASGRVGFGHSGFQSRIQAIAIPYSAAAENVAYNQGSTDPATTAVQGWLKSTGHLTNIKGNYNLTGIGVANNSRGQIYFTQIFLRSR
ncbi:CAP domain-containing protein [Anabaena cylindrica FACHB-243]|uniref:SCP-like extracellular n=1 Tax=Anabaena cylindrica (strain ATCC 27899 / PCC 7122) TaxID=272123 RepID=K9ZB21_ANACC|nr:MULTISPECIES: CAP domain-containing protein [Anabaena]AFZ55934.1 SCP-like extracellular [Anabaena cylindrica PCC 7122]MBD2421355.1 CAP domain-containing protein [Anabaena cylindrica FACHB-243]MBY5285230.1 CAP domain-containing protein [Anabaena sp. CCAP 1446/1C]MBY5308573.1 CAP domain-containing protein [Anabaena sp. CCAP 1446/1C]MCM2406687.1 CAP domain-containing protein [Anabaena sp. CCAP 1446/1C]